jgi:ABC-2 type transport system ATP-binding protein
MSAYSLEVENLVKVYSGGRTLFGPKSEPVRAVEGLSFQVPRGAIFGLLGPNGAGKTTLLKILSTLLEPTSGHARIEGFDVVLQPLEVRRRICMVLQETAVELFLSVRDNFLTFAKFHGLAGADASRQTGEAIDLFDLRAEADRKVQDLSGGYKRRVQVAKVFIAQTPVLFLDEFSTGMDPILKRAVMESLRKEAARGRTIVLTTQILSEAEELCDDILILDQGRQIARGDLNALKLLTKSVSEIVIAFEQLPSGIEDVIAKLQPWHSKITGNTVELVLKTEETQALDTVSELAKMGRVLRVEIGGASLEDIFVELTKKN